MKTADKNKDVLIAYIPTSKDLKIAYEKCWYRIPVSSKNTPLMVKNGTIKLIAFYQPKVFKDEAFSVRWFGIVKKISTVKRKQLFRSEPINPKSDNMYYKISFEKLFRLPSAIISKRHRRIIFITTNFERFENAREINDLFLESPIEEKFWSEMKKNSIPAERQYLETIGTKNYFLDFAIFCKNRKIAIECDGDTYHLDKDTVKNDKRRDNQLESREWNVFRYCTDDIEYKMDETLLQVRETINRYGGLDLASEEEGSRFFAKKQDGLTLFE